MTRPNLLLHLALVAITAIVLSTTAGPARAELHLDITRGKIEPMPIAIPDFSGGANGAAIAHDVTQVLSADLERSGLFKPLDSKAFIDKEAATRTPPRYGDWRLINAQALVTGTAETQPDGRLQVEFRLWDVFAEQQLTGLRYT